MSLRRPAPAVHPASDCTLETPFISQRAASMNNGLRAWVAGQDHCGTNPKGGARRFSLRLLLGARARRQRVVSLAGIHPQARPVYAHLDRPMRTRGGSACVVTDRILIASFFSHARVRLLDCV